MFFDTLLYYNSELQLLTTLAMCLLFAVGVIGFLYWLFITQPKTARKAQEEQRIQQDLINEHLDRERQWMERNEALMETLAERLERIAELLEEERSKTI